MKVPRDLSGAALIKRLEPFGYEITRQTGSHVRLTFKRDVQHHVTVPLHDPLRIATLAAILDGVASHHGLARDALLHRLLD